MKITIPFENKAASPVLGAMHQGRDGNRFLGAREEMGAIRRMRGVGKAAAGRNSGGASLRSCGEGAGASRPKAEGASKAGVIDQSSQGDPRLLFW